MQALLQPATFPGLSVGPLRGAGPEKNRKAGIRGDHPNAANGDQWPEARVRTVWVEVCLAARLMAALVIGDRHGDVEPIDDRNYWANHPSAIYPERADDRKPHSPS